jgi:transposase
MGYRKTRVGLLVQLDPKQAARQLLTTYRRYHGNSTKTAKAYGVSLSTLKRWVVTLDKQGLEMRDEIEAIRDQVVL